MFSSYFDVIIMRARYPHFAEACAYLMNDLDRISDSDRTGQRGVPIINAGSGADEHPTQALLDMYTLQRIFSFESKKDSTPPRRLDEIPRRDTDLTAGGTAPAAAETARARGATGRFAASAATSAAAGRGGPWSTSSPFMTRGRCAPATRPVPSSTFPPTCSTSGSKRGSASASGTTSR